MQDRKLYLIFHAALFLIPINIYMIGDWLGTGIQWILFRYQSTYLGSSFIPINRDLHYILNGTIGGRSGLSWGIWIVAASILIISLVFHIAQYLSHNPLTRVPGLLILAGGILFLLADLIQYGILLHGMIGFCIPLGIPLILVYGWLLYKQSSVPDVKATVVQ